MNSNNLARINSGFDVLFLVNRIVKSNNVARLCIFSTREKFGIVIIDSIVGTIEG